MTWEAAGVVLAGLAVCTTLLGWLVSRLRGATEHRLGRIETALDSLNGFQDEVLRDYATRRDMKDTRDECLQNFNDIFGRLRCLETGKDGPGGS